MDLVRLICRLANDRGNALGCAYGEAGAHTVTPDSIGIILCLDLVVVDWYR